MAIDIPPEIDISWLSTLKRISRVGYEPSHKSNTYPYETNLMKIIHLIEAMWG
jgi:hypothetical protein